MADPTVTAAQVVQQVEEEFQLRVQSAAPGSYDPDRREKDKARWIELIATALTAAHQAGRVAGLEEAANLANEATLRMATEQHWSRQQHTSHATAKGMEIMAARLWEDLRRRAHPNDDTMKQIRARDHSENDE